jgi:hypothetical protein
MKANRERGFLLGDALMAAMIVAFAVAGVVQVIKAYKKGLLLERERATAWELAGHARSLPPAFLATHPSRSFDFRGLPDGGHAYFNVEVETEERDALLVMRGKVTYTDGEGVPRSLGFERLVWRGAP